MESPAKREAPTSISSLPTPLLASILQRVVDEYRVFPAALVSREWHQTIRDLPVRISIPGLNKGASPIQGEEFTKAMSDPGSIATLKLDAKAVTDLTECLESPEHNCWCARVERLSIHNCDNDLTGGDTLSAFVNAASLACLPREYPDPDIILSGNLEDLKKLARLELRGFHAPPLWTLPTSL